MSDRPQPIRVKDLPPIDLDSDSSTESDGKSITQILQTIVEQRSQQRRSTLLPAEFELSKVNSCCPDDSLKAEYVDVQNDPKQHVVEEESLWETAPFLDTPSSKKSQMKEENIIVSVKKGLHENNKNLANLNLEKTERTKKCNSVTKIISSTSDEPKKSSHMINVNGKGYKVLRRLGQGGSSVVYESEMIDKKIQCALKVINLNGNESMLSDNMNEIKLLRKLQGKSIVTLIDHFYSPEDSILYIVMEKGEKDLSAILKDYTKNLPVYTIMDFWHQMLKCVKFIHEHGVIHCDIKPANFLMVNGRLKLIDFGISSDISLDSTSIIKHTQAGTYNYISPEALIDISSDEDTRQNVPKIRISPKTDVWSLGCIFFQFLFKVTPFGNIKNITNKIMAICSPESAILYPPLSPCYPAIFIEIAQKCLKHNPKERISIQELLEYPFEMYLPSL
ncbi:dual specificity protein kinase TTK [Sergentomyia squamirostris]